MRQAFCHMLGIHGTWPLGTHEMVEDSDSCFVVLLSGGVNIKL